MDRRAACWEYDVGSGYWLALVGPELRQEEENERTGEGVANRTEGRSWP